MNQRILIALIALIMSCTKEHPMLAQKIQLIVGEKTYDVTLYDNSTANSFKKLLPTTLQMNDLNNNEKYNYLSSNLPTNPTPAGEIKRGEIMLWGANCLVLFYKSFSSSYSYSRIGFIDDPTGLESALGTTTTNLTFKTSTTTAITSTKADTPSVQISFPNPHKIAVEGLFSKLTLCTLKGEIITTATHSPIDWSNMKKGVYILQIRQRERTLQKKIVKQ